MQAKITKEQLKKLNAQMGRLDKDGGQVFVQFVGKLESDGLYHGELQFRPPTDTDKPASFSVAEILNEKTNGDTDDSGSRRKR